MGNDNASAQQNRQADASPRAMQALDNLRATLADVDALTTKWRELNALVEPDDVVALSVGAPDTSALTELAEAYEALQGRPLPGFYVRLISTFNGIAASSTDEYDDDEADITVPASELGEPCLWPAHASFDALTLSEAPFDEIGCAIIIGALPDSGFLVFDGDAVNDSNEDAPTFWVPRYFASHPAVRLTDSIAELVVELCKHGLHIPSLLRAHGVPGWG